MLCRSWYFLVQKASRRGQLWRHSHDSSNIHPMVKKPHTPISSGTSTISCTFSVNKHERSEIKKIILMQIDLLVEELPTLGSAAGEKLRLERLKTALMRIDADNFGVCFKCEKTIPMSRLRILPESIICIDCLETPTA